MYEWLKLIHILSSVLMVGTGFGSAFYMYMANRSKNLQAQLIVTRLVVKADWWFTTPTIIIQPVSGIAMIYLAGWPMDASWLLWSYTLYGLAALCWLPVVWLQIQMRDMAAIASSTSSTLPATFWRYARYWEYLGYPAFIAMMLIYWLMVSKPS
jgi:uncharacterized membrane protein